MINLLCSILSFVPCREVSCSALTQTLRAVNKSLAAWTFACKEWLLFISSLACYSTQILNLQDILWPAQDSPVSKTLFPDEPAFSCRCHQNSIPWYLKQLHRSCCQTVRSPLPRQATTKRDPPVLLTPLSHSMKADVSLIHWGNEKSASRSGAERKLGISSLRKKCTWRHLLQVSLPVTATH